MFVAALVKYNPCSVYARKGVPCPFFLPEVGKLCRKPYGFCDSPEYDRWLKDVLEGKIKCFYPNRIRLLEIPGTFLLLYHTHKRAIIGEAKIIKVTSKNNEHYYWFDHFVLYPNPVNLKLIRTDYRLKERAKRGRWRVIYLSQETLEEIRDLSELKGKSKERLRRELELAREEVERRRSYLSKDRKSFLEVEIKKLMDLGVEQKIIKKTKEIFLEALKRKLRIPSKLMFYASLYLAFRSFGVPKRLNEIQKIENFNSKKLVSAIKLLLRNLEIKLPIIGPKEWILRYSEKLETSQRTVQAAINLAEKMKSEKSLKHKSPISIAATAMYIAALRTGEKITQKKIANAFGISSVTLRNLKQLWTFTQTNQGNIK